MVDLSGKVRTTQQIEGEIGNAQSLNGEINAVEKLKGFISMNKQEIMKGEINKSEVMSGDIILPNIAKKELFFASHQNFPNIGDGDRLYIATDEKAIYMFDSENLIYTCIARDYNEIDEIICTF